MSTPAWLAFGATCGGVVALLADGRRGAMTAAIGLGLGGGGIASLAGGLSAFLLLGGAAAAAAIVIGLGGGSGRQGGALGPLVPAVPAELFGSRAVRVAAGVAALLVARWLAVHLVAGLVSSPAPVFSCAFLWEVAVLRVALARTALEIGTGLLTAAVATAAFILLGGGTEQLGLAGLLVGAGAAGGAATALPRRPPA